MLVIGSHPYGFGPVVLPPLPVVDGPTYPAPTKLVVVVTMMETVTEQVPVLPGWVGVTVAPPPVVDGVPGMVFPALKTALNEVLVPESEN